jgi:competence protein ComEA
MARVAHSIPQEAPMLLLVPVLALVLAGPALAASPAPPLRSSVPSTVTAPRAPARPVRVVEPARPASRARATDAPAVEKVNINSADVTTLMTLSGVTRKVAQNIVAHRERHGPFRKAADVRKVEGVGDGLWERNRARIVTK